MKEGGVKDNCGTENTMLSSEDPANDSTTKRKARLASFRDVEPGFHCVVNPDDAGRGTRCRDASRGSTKRSGSQQERRNYPGCKSLLQRLKYRTLTAMWRTIYRAMKKIERDPRESPP